MTDLNLLFVFRLLELQPGSLNLHSGVDWGHSIWLFGYPIVLSSYEKDLMKGRGGSLMDNDLLLAEEILILEQVAIDQSDSTKA